MAQEIADSKLLDTWSSDGLKVKPDISKIIEGWQLGEQPPHEYMNWLQNTFGSKLNHILKNGVSKWNNETTYLAGSSVQHSGNVWLCKVDNTNSEPTDVNVNWENTQSSKSAKTINDLKTKSGGVINVLGYYEKGDGGGGLFYWDDTSTEADNGGTIIQSTGITTGRWKRVYNGAVNVKWFGAVSIEDNSTFDSYMAIQSAVDYIESLVDSGNLTPAVPELFSNETYSISSTITVVKNININLTKPLVKNFLSGIGISIANGYGNNIRVSISRGTRDWSVSDDIGIQLKNLINSSIIIDSVENQSIGLKVVGDGAGFAYNNIKLGMLYKNKYSLILDSINSGYVNENLWLDGRFAGSSAITDEGDRFGIYIKSSDGTYKNNNNNIFIKPCFELYPQGSDIAYPITIDGGRRNKFMYCRNEGNGNASLFANVLYGDANYFDIGYEEIGTKSKIYETSTTNQVVKDCLPEFSNERLKQLTNVFNSGNLGDMTLNEGTDTVIQGGPLYFRRYNTNNLNKLPVLSNSESIEMNNSLYAIGIDLDLSENKEFRLSTTLSSNSTMGVRYCFIPKDSSGNVITGLSSVDIITAPFKYDSINLAYYSDRFGGSYSTTADDTYPTVPLIYKFGDNVKSVSVLIVGGSQGGVAYLKDISVDSYGNIGKGKVMVKKGLPYTDGVFFLSSQPTDTSRYYRAGEICYKINPTAGGNVGWVCVAPGTPGTWKAFGAISA